MRAILNVAAYRFVTIPSPAELQIPLHDAARAGGLKGTVLVAGEGINLTLAGAPVAVRAFLAHLQADPRFADLDVKESWSCVQPYRRLRVRVRREIIRMNDPSIRPAAGRAPAIDARTLKRWLDAGHDDEGRPVVMLDTRNRYEVAAGRFAGALDLTLDSFTQFPAAAAAARDRLTGRTVVSYCTGGIRCEKAALVLDRLDLAAHYQLDGGILRYFEQVGGAHFEGDCMVFDERQALTPELAPISAPAGEAAAPRADYSPV